MTLSGGSLSCVPILLHLWDEFLKGFGNILRGLRTPCDYLALPDAPPPQEVIIFSDRQMLMRSKAICLGI